MASGIAPAFNPFTLTLVQLGSIGSDKAANLKHAREMVMKAAESGSGTKPQVVVLPVCDQLSSSDISS
jgi:omega-amidase